MGGLMALGYPGKSRKYALYCISFPIPTAPANHNKSMNMQYSTEKPRNYMERIQQLGQAIFYVYNESGYRQAAGLIQPDRVDDEGNIWFHVSRLPLITESGNCLGELVFYRKGLPFHLCVFGAAMIQATDPLLLRFHVNHVDYYALEETVSVEGLMLKIPVIRLLTPSFYHQRHVKFQ